MTLFDVDGNEYAPEADDEGAVRIVEVEKRHSPVCALCAGPARMWSGVEGWLVDGLWIGWCSKEHQRRWINGERLADRRSGGV